MNAAADRSGVSGPVKHTSGAKTVIDIKGLTYMLFAAWASFGATLPPIPKYLQNRPDELWVRNGDEIVRSPREDVEVARAYAYSDSQHKGGIRDGQRITIMTAKTEYRIGEKVRVVHVLEASEPGHELWVMGPKSVQEEYVDGRLASSPRSLAWFYDGAVLESPGADFNYEITVYTFTKPGAHTILWKGGEYFTPDPGLTSNVLHIEVKEGNVPAPYDRRYRTEFLDRLSLVKEGYTEEQVLLAAGKPDSYSKGAWCYKWSEPNGGLYDQFRFSFDDGVVTKIDRTSGCEAVY
jgi:hypothetical protein